MGDCCRYPPLREFKVVFALLLEFKVVLKFAFIRNLIFGQAKSQFLDEIPKLIVMPQIGFWTGQTSISGRSTKINFEATN